MLFGRVDPRQQFAEMLPFIDPVETPKPLAENRKALSCQQSHRGHPLWGCHLYLPSVTQSYWYACQGKTG